MTKASEPVRLGLMGCGQRLRSVVEALLLAGGDRIEVAAVYDPDPGSQAEAFSAFGSGIVNCASEEELATLSSLDWIFVGSPNTHHARQSALALRAGKNVFCEKPLAIDLEDCLTVREAVRETGRTFAFGLVLRYSPHYQKIRDLVHSGVIGNLISFEFNETLPFNHGGYIFGNWRRQRAVAGTHLLEKCCHDLDIANWITESRPRRAASFGGRDFFIPVHESHISRIGPNTEGLPAYQTWPDPHRVNPFSEGADIVDNQVIIMEYENGVRATFHTNCNAGIPERRFYLCGTEGSLRADACTGQIEWKRIGHETRMEQFETKIKHSHAGGDAVMAQGLADTLLRNEPPLASVDEGVLACITASGVDSAMDSGKITDFKNLYKTYLGGQV
jgi:predicted dehydrogenase